MAKKSDNPWIKDLLNDSDLQPLITESKILGRMQQYIGQDRSLGDSRAMCRSLSDAEKRIDGYISKRSTTMSLGVSHEYGTKRECPRMIENAVSEGTAAFQAETGEVLPR